MVNTGQMLRQILLIFLAFLPMRPAWAEAPPGPDSLPECIEAVARVRILAYHPTELGPLEEDEIVHSWTWDVDVDVKEVYLGDIPRGKLTIGVTLHAQFDRELLQPVFFFTRKFGTWYVSYVEFAASAKEGGYVIPVFSQPVQGELSPEGWLPEDYMNWLRPVSYRRADVKGFSDPYGSYGQDANWVSIQNRHVIAKRGFATKDIPAMLAERRSLECVSDRRERAPPGAG